MGEKLLKNMCIEAREIFLSSLKAVDPYAAVKHSVQIVGNKLILSTEEQDTTELDLTKYDRVFLVGGGKATAPMARAVEDLFGGKIHKGIINVKYGYTEKLSLTRIIEAGHPLPDRNGIEGTKRIIALLKGCGKKDLIFSLISGGGSALLPLPAGNITLSEKLKITSSLMACGATIDEINAVRKHISSVKGGQMARAAYPATTINLMLSDVVGNKMDVIASGPFVPDSSTFNDAWEILKKHNLKNIPATILAHLKSGIEGLVPETPKIDEPFFGSVHSLIVASNTLALKAASKKARELGYKTMILSSMIEGDTTQVAHVHSAIAKEIIQTGNPIPSPACILSGGETTVTIKGKGLGGRNQEFALAAAMDIAGAENIVILSGGSDGTDGPTDAAGAIVDTNTLSRAMDMGLNPGHFLANNDSYHFFQKLGDLLITGPTNTNVMDLRILLVTTSTTLTQNEPAP